MNLETLEIKYADLRQYLESRALLIEMDVDRDWLADRLGNFESILRSIGEPEESIQWMIEEAWLIIVLGVGRKR